MALTETLDEWGKPAWIGLVILGFMIFWPLGFVALGFAIGKGRIMGCGGRMGPGRWERKMTRMQERMDTMRGRMERAGERWGRTPSASGNSAFDAYREETLRRLEEEQREFRDFLDRLRFAKDKTEFDQFMAERRDRPEQPTAPQS